MIDFDVRGIECEYNKNKRRFEMIVRNGRWGASDDLHAFKVEPTDSVIQLRQNYELLMRQAVQSAIHLINKEEENDLPN